VTVPRSIPSATPSERAAGGAASCAVRVELPFHLRTLARVAGEVTVVVDGPVTIGAVIDAVEATFPVLRGTIRDYGTLKRRPFLRYFACQEDVSHEPADFVLPARIASGDEPFLVIGSISGG
jgi:hypothetical protein